MSTLKVLVVEDDIVSRKVLENTLENLGHEVVLAEDGTEAWEKFNTSPTRIVISDWVLPKLDGLSLCERVRLRKNTPYTYFILLTARKGQNDYLHAMNSGVDEFMIKPVDPDQLGIRLWVAERILGTTSKTITNQALHFCVACQKIQDENGIWRELAEYSAKHSKTPENLCPKCKTDAGF